MRLRASPPLTWTEISWPRHVEAADLTSALRRLAGSRTTPLLVRSEGRNETVRHLIGTTDARHLAPLAQHLGGLQLRDVPVEGEPETSSALKLALKFSTRQRPVRHDDAHATLGLVQALAQAGRTERVTLEWALLGALAPQTVGSNEPAELGPRDLLRAPFGAPSPLGSEARRALVEKRAEAGWRAAGRLVVAATTPARRRALASGVLAALRALESPGLHLRVSASSLVRLGHATDLSLRPVALSLRELPFLAGWPVGDLSDLGGLPVRFERSRHLPAAASLPHFDPERSQRLVAVGRRDDRPRALTLSPRDGTRSLHVVGPTGVGKSTMLLRLIQADMAAGRSLVVFDPKSDLIRDALDRVPEERHDDVVVLDLTSERPVGLNPLAGSSQRRDPDLLAEGLLGTLHELFADSWGVRTQDALHAALLTLARRGDASLAAVPLLLTNPAYRARVTAGLDDPLGIGGFWEQFERLSDADRLNQIGPVLNKLRQVLNRPSLRGSLGQLRPRFDLAEVFERPRIVLVDLSKGSLGADGSALFGAVAWAQLWQAALRQGQRPPDTRRLVTVFADEFQDYLKAAVSFTDMLVQCRGLGVGLVLAHQHLGQLGTHVREAVLANAGSRVTFQLLADDARVMAQLGGGLTAEDFSSLSAYEVYANLRVSGEATGWMSGRTLPASEPTCNGNDLRRRSAERYGVPRADTESSLRALLEVGDDDPPADVGVRRRRRS